MEKTENIEDDCLDNLVTSYSILASTGIKIITKDGKDITNDIIKAKPLTGDVTDD